MAYAFIILAFGSKESSKRGWKQREVFENEEEESEVWRVSGKKGAGERERVRENYFEDY